VLRIINFPRPSGNNKLLLLSIAHDDSRLCAGACAPLPMAWKKKGIGESNVLML